MRNGLIYREKDQNLLFCMPTANEKACNLTFLQWVKICSNNNLTIVLNELLVSENERESGNAHEELSY